MAYTSSYFAHAMNTTIIHPQITHVNGDALFSSSEHYGLKLLLENIAKGAFHDSAERGNPPKCHPHTCVAIRKEVMEWIRGPEARHKLILWMYGPAGSGKTAIGQSIAEECKKQGLLAASFFFSHTAPWRNDTARFVATIAYQISRFIPAIKDHLLTAIEQDPTIFSLTLATQIQTLVIEPLQASPPSLMPIFVILDGVDEIGSKAEQADLLNTFGAAVSELRHIPLKLLISSCPEYEIREAFNGTLLNPLVRLLVLDDTYKPDSDIRLYFDSTFEAIRNKHIRLRTRLPSPWPSETDVRRLVSKSSGQFVFAATVVRFIDSIRQHPAERLDIILGLSTPGNEMPFALLDALYHHILSSVTDLPKVLMILTVLMLGSGDGASYVDQDLNAEMIEKLLGFEVRQPLVDMHALVFVPPPGNNNSILQIHHASLYDFLMDQSRSHIFYIGVSQGHLALSQCWLKHIANDDISRPLHISYCVRGLVYHCRKSPPYSDFPGVLASFNLRQQLEDINIGEYSTFQTPPWADFFAYAKQQAGDQIDVFPRLQNEFDAFILECLSKYPPILQACIPTIIALSADIRVKADIFYILLYCINQSPTELDKARRLNWKLLAIASLLTGPPDDVFAFLFKDHSRAGQHAVHGGSFVTLAKLIVRTICHGSREDNQQVRFERISFGTYTYGHESDGYNWDHYRYRYDSSTSPTMHIPLINSAFKWFDTILSSASVDVDLARVLHEHALQCGPDVELMEGWWNIARASLKYIQRCGIPDLEHAHPPDTRFCVMCDEESYSDIDSDLLERSNSAPFSPSSASESPSATREVDQPPNNLDNSHVNIPIYHSDIPTTSVAPPASISWNQTPSTTLPSISEAPPVTEPPTTLKRKRGSQSSNEELRRTK